MHKFVLFGGLHEPAAVQAQRAQYREHVHVAAAAQLLHAVQHGQEAAGAADAGAAVRDDRPAAGDVAGVRRELLLVGLLPLRLRRLGRDSVGLVGVDHVEDAQRQVEDVPGIRHLVVLPVGIPKEKCVVVTKGRVDR